jgi:uncharacterized membrane protein YeiB
MQLINKKNFLSIVCSVYTIISLGKIIAEKMMGLNDQFYAENFITIFFLSVAATLVLGLHYYLQKVPIIIVILGQYIFLVGIMMFGIWIESHFTAISPSGYRDMFLSFTGPYIIFAIVYYISYLLQLRKANKTLVELKKDGGYMDECEEEGSQRR